MRSCRKNCRAVAQVCSLSGRLRGDCGSLDAHSRDSLYRWKNTIGPLEERPVRRNRWDYNQSNGLDFYGLFQFCEDIGAQPLPVLSAGYDTPSVPRRWTRWTSGLPTHWS